MILNKLFDVSALKSLLTNNPKIIITTHQNPDGDAVGSMLGLALCLKKMGCEVISISPNEYPEFLKWMPGNESVKDYTQTKKEADWAIEKADIIFQVDYNDVKRSGDMKDALSKSQAFKVMIDHHPNPQLQNNVMISATEVSSTCELVFEFISTVCGEEIIDRDMAVCLYTGIMTDTGCFNYSSSRPRTFEVVSKLLQRNIPKDEIYSNVFNNFSENRLRFLGFCLNNKMETFPEHNTAFMSITLEEQDKFKFTTGDSEGFVNFPLSIKGIIFTAFFTERKDKIKISFRSRGSFPANLFAEKHFGGGGHLNAAGGESNLPLGETIQKFKDLLPLYSDMLNK